MDDTDTYYRRRIAEELAAANEADDPDIAQLHRDMAQQYLERLSVSSGGSAPLPGLAHDQDNHPG